MIKTAHRFVACDERGQIAREPIVARRKSSFKFCVPFITHFCGRCFEVTHERIVEASRLIVISCQRVDEGDRAFFAWGEIETINKPGWKDFVGVRPGSLKRVSLCANRFAHDRTAIPIDGTRVVELTRRIGRIPRSYTPGYSAIKREFDLSLAPCLLHIRYCQRNRDRHLLKRHNRHARKFEATVPGATFDSVWLPSEFNHLF